VADATLGFDRGKKLDLYAGHSIPEYWIVNLTDKRLEVHREPGPAGYGVQLTFAAGENVAPAQLPNVVVELSEILG
jgi:Uma2 family endonuclease